MTSHPLVFPDHIVDALRVDPTPIPVEFSIPCDPARAERAIRVGSAQHSEIAYLQLVSGRVAHYQMLLDLPQARSFVEESPQVDPWNLIAHAAPVAFVPAPNLRLRSVDFGVEGAVGNARFYDARVQSSSPVRIDTSVRMTREPYSANFDVMQFSGIDRVRVDVDLGYQRRPGEPWRTDARSVVRITVDHPAGMQVACSIDEPHSFAVSVAVSRGPVRDTSIITVSLDTASDKFVHGQRPCFSLTIGLVAAGSQLHYPLQDTAALWCGWCDGDPRNALLTTDYVPEVSVDSARGIRTLLMGRVETVRANAVSTDLWRNRVLEGNEYSAAPGGDWLNMGRCHAAGMLVARCPEYIEVLRDGAIGLTLLRIHNVTERDGSLVKAANHPDLLTNRQLPHHSGRDMLEAGEEPPTSYQPLGAGLGLGNRNARDGEHYEIGVADTYLAFRIDYAVARSRKQMLELDCRRTNLLSGWSAVSRDVGRTVSQLSDAVCVLDGYTDLMRVQGEGWIVAACDKWRGKVDLPGAVLSGQRFLVASIHSDVNGLSMCAPYEEQLFGTGFDKFARTFPQSPYAQLAANLSYLICASVVMTVRDKEGEPGGLWTSYLVEVRGNGLPPRQENDIIGGANYTEKVMAAVRTFIRQYIERGSPPGEAAIYERALEINRRFTESCQGESNIRWGSV